MEYEYNQDYEDDFWWGDRSRYDKKYAKLYQKCKEIVDKLEGKLEEFYVIYDEGMHVRILY